MKVPVPVPVSELLVRGRSREPMLIRHRLPMLVPVFEVPFRQNRYTVPVSVFKEPIRHLHQVLDRDSTP